MKTIFNYIFIGIGLGCVLLIGFNFMNPVNYSKESRSEILNPKNLLPIVITDQQVYTAGDTVRGEVRLVVKSKLLPFKISSTISGEGGIKRVNDVWNISSDFHGDTRYNRYGIREGVLEVDYLLRGNSFDTTWKVTNFYEYSKTVMNVQWGSSLPFYKNCGNTIRVLAPILGSKYRPNFKAKGGKVIPGRRIEDLVVIPDSNVVDVEIYNNGSEIGREKFDVIEVPFPQVILRIHGKPLSKDQILDGIELSRIKSLTMRVIGHSEFRAALPKESRYRFIANMCLYRDGEMMLEKDSISSKNLGRVFPNVKTDDVLEIEIIEIVRRMSTGGFELVPYSFKESLKIK